MFVVSSCLYALLSFFVSAPKKQRKRCFCSLQEDLDNESLREKVYFIEGELFALLNY